MVESIDYVTLADFRSSLAKRYSLDNADYNRGSLQNILSGEIDMCIITYMHSDNLEMTKFIFSKKGCYMGMEKIGGNGGQLLDWNFPVVILDIKVAENILNRLEGVYITNKFPKLNSEGSNHIVEEPPANNALIYIEIYSGGKVIRDRLISGGMYPYIDNSYDYSYNVSKIIEIINILTREYLTKTGQKGFDFLDNKDFQIISL